MAEQVISTGFIYFIRAGDAGPIKVGYATDVRQRLSNLQTGCPCPLVLLYHEPGTLADEIDWHERLREFHIRGEWFRPNWMIGQHLKRQGVRMKPYVPLPYIRAERQFSQEGPLKRALRERAEKAARKPRRIAMAQMSAQCAEVRPHDHL